MNHSETSLSTNLNKIISVSWLLFQVFFKTKMAEKSVNSDTEILKEFKKNLICSYCKTFPIHQGTTIYSCPQCSLTFCECCKETLEGICNKCRPHNFGYYSTVSLVIDRGSTIIRGLLKYFPCKFANNGCKEEPKIIELSTHERICPFRRVTCPYEDCKQVCAFNDFTNVIEKHFITKHMKEKDVIYKNDKVLNFKNSIEYLKNDAIFFMKTYGRSFFPQFYVKENQLHFWVVGSGDRIESECYEVSIAFCINGKWGKPYHDVVQCADIDKKLFKSGECGLIFPIKKLTKYLDEKTSEYKHQENVEFQLKIVCEKLEEIAKDENVESGVEDSE